MRAPLSIGCPFEWVLLKVLPYGAFVELAAMNLASNFFCMNAGNGCDFTPQIVVELNISSQNVQMTVGP